MAASGDLLIHVPGGGAGAGGRRRRARTTSRRCSRRSAADRRRRPRPLPRGDPARARPGAGLSASFRTPPGLARSIKRVGWDACSTALEPLARRRQLRRAHHARATRPPPGVAHAGTARSPAERGRATILERERRAGRAACPTPPSRNGQVGAAPVERRLGRAEARSSPTRRPDPPPRCRHRDREPALGRRVRALGQLPSSWRWLAASPARRRIGADRGPARARGPADPLRSTASRWCSARATWSPTRPRPAARRARAGRPGGAASTSWRAATACAPGACATCPPACATPTTWWCRPRAARRPGTARCNVAGRRPRVRPRALMASGARRHTSTGADRGGGAHPLSCCVVGVAAMALAGGGEEQDEADGDQPARPERPVELTIAASGDLLIHSPVAAQALATAAASATTSGPCSARCRPDRALGRPRHLPLETPLTAGEPCRASPTLPHAAGLAGSIALAAGTPAAPPRTTPSTPAQTASDFTLARARPRGRRALRHQPRSPRRRARR